MYKTTILDIKKALLWALGKDVNRPSLTAIHKTRKTIETCSGKRFMRFHFFKEDHCSELFEKLAKYSPEFVRNKKTSPDGTPVEEFLGSSSVDSYPHVDKVLPPFKEDAVPAADLPCHDVYKLYTLLKALTDDITDKNLALYASGPVSVARWDDVHYGHMYFLVQSGMTILRNDKKRELEHATALQSVYLDTIKDGGKEAQ